MPRVLLTCSGLDRLWAMDHLTHGWEPELADSDTLLRRFVLASAHRSVDLAIRGGGRGELRPTISLADPASPVMFDNIAVLLQPPAYIDLDATMEELVAFFPSERHVMLLSAWPTPDLSRHGFSLMGHPPLMYRAPEGRRRRGPTASRSGPWRTRRRWRSS